MGALLELHRKAKREWELKQPPKPKPLLRSLPLAKLCIHNTGPNGTAKAGCTTCTTYGCKVKGTIRPYECVYCTDYEYHEKPAIQAGNSWQAVRFDHTNLFPELPHKRFNASIIESGDGFIFAWRNNWRGSNIYLARLDANFKPIGEASKLELGSAGARIGREDPRLFRLNGKLHLWYIGYNGGRKVLLDNVLFARINEETLTVEDKFYPKLTGRNLTEKNWACFDYQGIVHAIYATAPNHKIVRIEGDKAEWSYETPFSGKYSGGEIRGGCSPVLHNGFLYHFFHGVVNKGKGRIYNIGLTKLRAEPPFDVVAYTPHPIDSADATGNWCIFPCGAVPLADRWAIAMGVDDQHCEIRFYDYDLVESQLIDHQAMQHVAK